MNAVVAPSFEPSQIVVEALRIELLIRTLIKDARTSIPVRVIAVHPGAGFPMAIGTVDVQPLVQTVGNDGRLWSLEKVYGAQFCRMQSGGNAFIMDPSEGDIGLAVVNDRDISSVIAAAGLAGPGSGRSHDISDLTYVMSILSGKDITQYILIDENGIKMMSPNTITIQGGQINLIGPVNANGATISDAGEVTDALGVVLGTHDHEPGTYVAGSTPVTGTSGAPIP